MKTFSTITMLLILVSISKAQDPNLPKGKSQIYLNSGKTVKNVLLWRIDSAKVEYVVNGNLADLKTTDVSKIETTNFLIEFDDENHIVKKDYDLIILNTHDTIRGFIQGIGDRNISYLSIGNDKKQTIPRTEVADYWQAKTINHFQKQAATPTFPADSVATKKDSTQTVSIPGAKVDVPMKNDSTIVTPVQVEAVQKKSDEDYYHLSYDRGVNDAIRHSSFLHGWGSGGFLLGMTFGSPFLSLAAIDSKVGNLLVPAGVDRKLYQDGYKNETIKKRAKKAAAGAAVAKVLILIIIIAAR